MRSCTHQTSLLVIFSPKRTDGFQIALCMGPEINVPGSNFLFFVFLDFLLYNSCFSFHWPAHQAQYISINHFKHP